MLLFLPCLVFFGLACFFLHLMLVISHVRSSPHFSLVEKIIASLFPPFATPFALPISLGYSGNVCDYNLCTILTFLHHLFYAIPNVSNLRIVTCSFRCIPLQPDLNLAPHLSFQLAAVADDCNCFLASEKENYKGIRLLQVLQNPTRAS